MNVIVYELSSHDTVCASAPTHLKNIFKLLKPYLMEYRKEYIEQKKIFLHKMIKACYILHTTLDESPANLAAYRNDCYPSIGCRLHWLPIVYIVDPHQHGTATPESIG